MRCLAHHVRRSPQWRSKIVVPILELQVQFGNGGLTRSERDIGLEGVDGGHHLGGDEDELGGVVEGGGTVWATRETTRLMVWLR